MTEHGSNELLNLLGDCIARLQSELIVKTGQVRVYVSSGDRRVWRGPALRPGIMLGNIYLNDLPRHLYGEQPLSERSVRMTWEDAGNALLTSRKPADAAKVIFPALPFTTRSAPPTAALVQLLCALWWSGGEFKVDRREAFLRVGGARYGLDQRIFTHGGMQRRLPRNCEVDCIQYLTMPLGTLKKASADATAVYRHLCVNLPDSAPALDVIFATAVHAGPEHERVLTSLFDLTPIDPVPVTASVWSKARHIVNTSVESPQPELWELLKGTINQKAFTKLFGNPHRAELARYMPAMRRRHVAAIDQFENNEINLAQFTKVGPHIEAANNLLKLQQMMGKQP